MTWQKILGREIQLFFLTVVVSFLFWFVLAIIVEQDIIFPEFLYIKERNAFLFTVAFFYFIRLSEWRSDERETPVDGKQRAQDIWAVNKKLRDKAGQIITAEATDRGGQNTADNVQHPAITQKTVS